MASEEFEPGAPTLFAQFFPILKPYLINKLQALQQSITDDAQMPNPDEVDKHVPGSPTKATYRDQLQGLIAYLNTLNTNNLEPNEAELRIEGDFKTFSKAWMNHSSFAVGHVHQCGQGCGKVNGLIQGFNTETLEVLKLLSYQLPQSGDDIGENDNDENNHNSTLAKFLTGFFDSPIQVEGSIDTPLRVIFDSASDQAPRFSSLISVLLNLSYKPSPQQIGVSNLSFVFNSQNASKLYQLARIRPAILMDESFEERNTQFRHQTVAEQIDGLALNDENFPEQVKTLLEIHLTSLKIALQESCRLKKAEDEIAASLVAIRNLIDAASPFLNAAQGQPINEQAFAQNVTAFEIAAREYQAVCLKFSTSETIFNGLARFFAALVSTAFGGAIGNFAALYLSLLIISFATPGGFAIFKSVFIGAESLLLTPQTFGIISGVAGSIAAIAIMVATLIANTCGAVFGFYCGAKAADALTTWGIFKLDSDKTRAEALDFKTTLEKQVDLKKQQIKPTVTAAA